MTSTRSVVLVTLGSNIRPEENLPAAVAMLAARVQVQAVSRVYETEPVGGVTQASFLNAAVRIGTRLPPLALRERVLRPIEAGLGRVRTADKFAPRPIDLDIALYGETVLCDDAAGLRLPDPGIARHAHLALPLAEVAPEVVLPGDGRALAEIAAALAPGSTARVRPDLRLALDGE